MIVLLRTLFLTALITAVSTFADPQKEKVNARPISTEDEAAILEQYEKEAKEHATQNTSFERNLDAKVVKGCTSCGSGCGSGCKKKKGKINFGFTTPTVYLPQDGHQLVYASTQRKAVTLEDGTVWKVRDRDVYRLLHWKADDINLNRGDLVFITQNNSWFSKYPYRIINQITRETVETYLYEGPVINGQYTNYIFAMDYNIGEIVFNNNLCWKLCESDESTYRHWSQNDPIIVGINTGWRSDYTHILINVNKPTHCVRAKPF